MRRVARIGIGAGLLTGVGAVVVGARRKIADRGLQRRAEAAEERRNLWPPVPVKPGAEAHIEASSIEPDEEPAGEDQAGSETA
jgi:hypothetical protein